MDKSQEILTKQEILQRLSEVKPQLEAFGVSKLGLFGSYVRGEATSKSDIDILIDFYKDCASLEALLDTSDCLQYLFDGKRIDLVTVNGLSKYIGPFILKDVQYV